ncbi:MAG: META domain-containing protein [Coriobacteriia bacterium]|nr:META domain-containing protein [Coriobacteriia bacterium]
MRVTTGVAAVLVVTAGVLLTAACVVDGELDGTAWRLVASSVSAADLGAASITASFDDGRIGGSGGVNSYSAQCTLGSDGSISVGDIESTLMAGLDEANAAEAAYFALLAGATTWRIDEGRLVLGNDAGSPLLVFIEAE